LPSLVQYLRQRAPSVDLQVRASDCSQLPEQLAAGEIDVAIAPRGGGRIAELHAERLWNDRLVTLVAKDNRLRDPMTIESYAAAAHLVDAGHVQVSPDGLGTSIVDAILAARGLRRRIALVLPNSAGIPFVVAATDLIATLPNRIVRGLVPMSNVRMLTPPLPDVEVSPHMFWHRRTHADPLQVWLRAAILAIVSRV
jgi:DNA-binding transcriptional LysR family regulator